MTADDRAARVERFVSGLVGDCLCVEPGHDPPRWRTERWPDPVMLEKLKAAATT